MTYEQCEKRMRNLKISIQIGRVILALGGVALIGGIAFDRDAALVIAILLSALSVWWTKYYVSEYLDAFVAAVEQYKRENQNPPQMGA